MGHLRHTLKVTDPDNVGGGGPQQPQPSRASLDVVTVANAVFAGLSTVFTATRSAVITAIAALLVALLALLIMLSRRQRP